MSKDDEGYERALWIQKMQQNMAKRKPIRHLGSADETCKICGNVIETLLNTEGKNPVRACWKCESETPAY